MVEKLAAAMTHIGTLVPKPGPNCRKGVKAAADQTAISTAGPMGDCQLRNESLVVVAHFPSARIATNHRLWRLTLGVQNLP